MTEADADRALERRVVDLEATLEIMRLEAEYARTWDLAQGARWADVFTEDGAFEVESRGERPGHRVVGREALKRHCEEFNATVTGVHFMHLPRVTVQGDSARGELYFEFQRLPREHGTEVQEGRSMGSYDVHYVRTPAGWRMKERRERPIRRVLQYVYGV